MIFICNTYFRIKKKDEKIGDQLLPAERTSAFVSNNFYFIFS